MDVDTYPCYESNYPSAANIYNLCYSPGSQLSLRVADFHEIDVFSRASSLNPESPPLKVQAETSSSTIQHMEMLDRHSWSLEWKPTNISDPITFQIASSWGGRCLFF